MIHYHGSPLGGNNQEKSRFYHGRHALVSYKYQTDLPVIAEVCRSFVFDNGAFTAWKQGEALDIEGFWRWAEIWHKHPGFDWLLIPDCIDGNEQDNDSMLRDTPSFIKKSKVVPVWHMHESNERLVKLCSDYDTVALGSSGDYKSPGSNTWWVRINAAMGSIVDDKGRPPCRLHGLRMLNPKIFTKIPLSSADSSYAARQVNLNQDRFGTYLPPKGFQRADIVASRSEFFNSASVFGAEEDEQYSLDLE
jgi:hypothetical protein